MLGKITIEFSGPDTTPKVRIEGEVPCMLLNAAFQEVRTQYNYSYVPERRRAEERILAEKKRIEAEKAAKEQPKQASQPVAPNKELDNGRSTKAVDVRGIVGAAKRS